VIPPRFGEARAPLPLLVAAALVALEGLGLVGLCIAEALSVSADKVAMGATTAVFFLLYGVALGVFAWLLGHRRSWPRAPVVLTQLLQLGLAWSFRGGVTTVAAVALAVVALAVLAGIFHPASLAALEPDRVDERA
jgi:hypothetical protein